MEAPEPVIEEVPARKNQTPLIIAAAALVLCCCCLVIAVAGYYGYTTLRIADSSVQPFDEEEVVPEFFPPSIDVTPADEFDLPGVDVGLGEPPVGSLGNDILINDTWQYVGFAAMGLGCDQPVGADSTIEVLQEPANGVWVEKWTVACESGDSYPFEVEYILDDTGATFNIKPLP